MRLNDMPQTAAERHEETPVTASLETAVPTFQPPVDRRQRTDRRKRDVAINFPDRRRSSDRRGDITPQSMQHVVVAVIPAFNEERFISSVVFQTRHYATHVVVVDDGSSDRTARLAQLAGAFVVKQPRNMGKAAALKAGFQAASRYNPDAIVCLDGDAQHEPAEIPEVVDPIVKGEADVVIGSRFLDKKSQIPGWRQVGQHTLTAVTNITSGTKTTDSQSGYRAFSPSAAAALDFRTGGLSVESEMQFLFGQAGLSVMEVPISVRYQDGNKRNPVVHGLQILDALISLVARRRPLLFLTLPGIIIGCLGLFFGVRVAWVMERTGELLTGSAILTTLLLVGGLMLSMTGVMLHSLGHFVKRIQEEIDTALLKYHG